MKTSDSGGLIGAFCLLVFWVLFLELELEWALLASAETCRITWQKTESLLSEKSSNLRLSMGKIYG